MRNRLIAAALAFGIAVAGGAAAAVLTSLGVKVKPFLARTNGSAISFAIVGDPVLR